MNQQIHDQRVTARDFEIVERREAGESWLAIQQRFDLTRQQARYAYQLAKRELRRRSASPPG